ncbi:hypothetical protein [Defluviitalea saccharophila]|uniref:Uncharacterized protein n=1 Tax=Defluviitalea saccharophila TaxID=879970 RepID=A0ABZ2Y5N1_9FIRM
MNNRDKKIIARINKERRMKDLKKKLYCYFLKRRSFGLTLKMGR